MTRATTIYTLAAELYDRGEWEAARHLYSAADALAQAEAYEREATDLGRPVLETIRVPVPIAEAVE